MADLPDGLSIARNRDLRAMLAGRVARWAVFALLVAFLAAAMLNAFGQRQTVSSAAGPAASLHVTSPPRVRGGLLYQSRIEVRAHRAIKSPQIVLDQGWLEQTTVNAIEPQPTDESSDDGRVVLTYDAMKPGDRLIAWIYFQVNPTNVGRHRTGVLLEDGSTPIARVHRTQLDLP